MEMKGRTPIDRLVNWFAERQKQCTFCRDALALEGSKYCSERCSELDYEMWVHG